MELKLTATCVFRPGTTAQARRELSQRFEDAEGFATSFSLGGSMIVEVQAPFPEQDLAGMVMGPEGFEGYDISRGMLGLYDTTSQYVEGFKQLPGVGGVKDVRAAIYRDGQAVLEQRRRQA